MHQSPPHGLHAGPAHPVPASRLLDFIDTQRLDACLQPLMPDAGDRAFVLRCLVGEGPMHHRGANYVLLALLAQAVQARGSVAAVPAPTPVPSPTPTLSGANPAAVAPATGAHPRVAVPMRLPPHLSDQVARGTYPLSLPTAALSALAGGDAAQVQAMVDCLTDGPPQHALANVAMVALLEQLLSPLPTPPGAPAHPHPHP